MNRVILCGRLAGRPRLAYTPCGIPVAEFRLLVPRSQRVDPTDPAIDRFDCVCFRVHAKELTTWGERDYRVNLEGQLHSETYFNLEGRRTEGPRVHVDQLYFVDPVALGLPGAPEHCPNVPLPVPVGRERR